MPRSSRKAIDAQLQGPSSANRLDDPGRRTSAGWPRSLYAATGDVLVLARLVSAGNEKGVGKASPAEGWEPVSALPSLVWL